MFWRPFSSKSRADEREKQRYHAAAKVIYELLRIQKTFIDDTSMMDDAGAVNAMALGYLYGFVDCALQSAGLEIRNYPGQGLILALLQDFDGPHADQLFNYLVDHSASSTLMEGLHAGGDDYLAWAKHGKDGAMTGLTGWRKTFSP